MPDCRIVSCAVDETESVLSRLNIQIGPNYSIDDVRVSQKVRDCGGARHWSCRQVRIVLIRTTNWFVLFYESGIEQLPIVVERPILDH